MRVRSVASFVRLSRVPFLAGGFVGGCLGTAIAVYERGSLDWAAYGIAQFAVTAFQLMTHYANDYFDRAGDALAVRTAFSGGSGTLIDGSLHPQVARRAALIALAAGALATVTAALDGLSWAAGIAACIGVLAWSYSAPPLRLSARGWGEADTALVVAVLVPLCAFCAQHAAPDARVLASTLPGGCAMLAMMLAVEYPDIAADAASGKRNIVVRLGEARANVLCYAAIAAVFPAAALSLAFGAPLVAALAQALSLAPAAAVARALALRRREGAGTEARLAARGVAFFFLVSFNGLLGYAVATNVPHPAVAERVTALSLPERVNAALDEVRPGILADGGDVWLIKVENATAYVQMVGACGGCAMSNATLKGAVERTVRERCPEIDRVEQL